MDYSLSHNAFPGEIRKKNSTHVDQSEHRVHKRTNRYFVFQGFNEMIVEQQAFSDMDIDY